MSLKFLDKEPNIHSSVYIAKGVHIIGDVTIEEDSSIWFNSVLRGDVNYIKIGKRTNIQDGCLLHVTNDLYPLILEDNITVGHGSILHGCTIRSNSFIGMGAILLDNVEVEKECIVAAGSVVREGTKIPSGTLMAGTPAIPKRKLSDKDLERITHAYQSYLNYKNVYNKNYK